ncbi:MAG: 50S ribosome-binding GTPase, partial [Planctomycetales bacterium]
MPKHKSSEKLQKELKTKISQAKKASETAKAGGKKGGGIRIPRQGAGTIVLLGGPNGGKSQLLKSLTRATPEVAEYPFTTRQPQPGMMPWEDVHAQLIDTPPVTADFLDPNLQGLIRGADLCLLVVDLGNDDGVERVAEALDRLNATKSRLGRESRLDEDDVGLSYTKTFTVANQMDQEGALDRLEMFHELTPLDFPEFQVSALDGTGLEELRDASFRALNVVRVYTKLPNAKEADFDKPFTLAAGSTVLEFAGMVHRDFAEGFKHARVWGAEHSGETVKGDHVVQDKDVVELHATTG